MDYSVLGFGVGGLGSFVFLQIVEKPISSPSETLSHLFFSVLLAAGSQLVIKFGSKWIDQLKFKRTRKIKVLKKPGPPFEMY